MKEIEVGTRLVDGIPENHEDITELLVERLKSNRLYGTIPTDLDALIGDAGMTLLKEDPGKVAAFLESLSEVSESVLRQFNVGKNKTKGAFGFRRKEIYVAPQKHSTFEVFPKAHEYTHGALPWHNLSFVDNRFTLSPEFEDQREREANFGAGQLIFQGDLFRERVMESDESLSSALVIAREHGATNSSTLWRFAEVHDREVVLLCYPKRRGYRLVRAVGSPSFCRKRRCLLVPDRIDVGHEWFNRPLRDPDVKAGESHLQCGADRVRVRWECWDNHYCQFVLLAVVTKLHTVSRFLTRVGGRIMTPSG